nr:hypothetical protein [Dechloromonas sp.]
MTTRLLLRIEEHWPARPEAAWVLLGHGGEVCAEGESDPRHWPGADECWVILAGPQCVWLETRLPRAARRDAQRLLGYALEDRLLGDPDSQHLTVSHRRRDAGNSEQVGVLVVARERLRELLAQFAALGRPLTRCVSEVQLAPSSADAWHVSVAGGTAIVRPAPDTGFAADVDLLPAVLDTQLAAARAANREPQRIVLHRAAGSIQPCPGEIPGLVDGQVYRWWQGAPIADNLLHDEFSVPGARPAWLAGLRTPVLMALAASVIWLLGSLGEIIWQRHQLAGIEARLTRTFQSAFPNSPPIAPLAQMRRQLNDERARHGLLRDDDALALLAAVADLLGTEATDHLAGLGYADGRLELRWPASFPRQRLADIQRGLAARGLLAEVSEKAGAPHLFVRTELLP